MTITDKLEGLLPADGNYTTDDERVIADALEELLRLSRMNGLYHSQMEDMDAVLDVAEASMRQLPRKLIEVGLAAFAAGCIASAIYVVLV